MHLGNCIIHLAKSRSIKWNIWKSCGLMWIIFYFVVMKKFKNVIISIKEKFKIGARKFEKRFFIAFDKDLIDVC